MKNKAIYNFLIGQDIDRARRLLGWWWTLENCELSTGYKARYIFTQSPNKKLILTTQKNIIMGVE